MRPFALVCAALFLVVSAGRASDARKFDPAEIRAAEAKLIAALQADDPTAWVYMYTKDAVLLEAGSEPLEGRDALLALAKSMRPLSSVALVTHRTEGQGNLAYVYGQGSWVNGRPPNVGSKSSVHLVLVWRKEADGQWRVLQEVLVPDAEDKKSGQ